MQLKKKLHLTWISFVGPLCHGEFEMQDPKSDDEV